MTMRVAAGAVAVAMAPRVMQAATESLSGIRRCRSSRAASTARVADRAWITAITAALRPVFLS